MDFEGAFLAWTALAIFIPLSLMIIIPGVYRTWVEHRSRSQALDVLRLYAEKGQEPPASVTAAIGAVASAGMPFINSAPTPPGAFSRPTRENHLAHVAGSVVCGLGAAGIAWWRWPDNGEPGPLVIWAVVVAIFFAGGVAARLVGVFTTPSGRPAMTDDDSALIDQIRDGSERAFNVLIDRHQQAVRGFLRRLLADASEADDLAQETFMVAWTRPGTYRGDASVRSWLCAIAWRKARDAQRAWFRRRAREARWAGDVEQIAAARSPESAVFARALAALPIEQRAAVVLCLIQDFSHAEAAGILGAPLGTVKSHVARGKARLLAVLRGPA